LTEYDWSDWLDFKKETISSIPETPGVFMMHASMKVLFISSSDNIKNELMSSIGTLCIADATRFRYMKTNTHSQIKDELINDYKSRHEGKLPKCMEENH